MDRLATPADTAALVAVINAAFVVEAGFIRGPRTTAAEVAALLAGSGVFLVLDHAEPGRLAAAVHVEAREGTAHVGMLAVEPALQGRGLARRLLTAVEAYARAAGCTVVELDVFDVRSELPPFYASLGYRPVGTRTFRAPELLTAPAHLIVMQKAIGAEPPG